MNDLLRAKIEKAWAFFNLIAFILFMIWGLLQDKANLKSQISGLPAFCGAVVYFSSAGYFIFTGRLPLRSGRYLIRRESPFSFGVIISLIFLIGFIILRFIF